MLFLHSLIHSVFISGSLFLFFIFWQEEIFFCPSHGKKRQKNVHSEFLFFLVWGRRDVEENWVQIDIASNLYFLLFPYFPSVPFYVALEYSLFFFVTQNEQTTVNLQIPDTEKFILFFPNSNRTKLFFSLFFNEKLLTKLFATFFYNIENEIKLKRIDWILMSHHLLVSFFFCLLYGYSHDTNTIWPSFFLCRERSLMCCSRETLLPASFFFSCRLKLNKGRQKVFFFLPCFNKKNFFFSSRAKNFSFSAQSPADNIYFFFGFFLHTLNYTEMRQPKKNCFLVLFEQHAMTKNRINWKFFLLLRIEMKIH